MQWLVRERRHRLKISSENGKARASFWSIACNFTFTLIRIRDLCPHREACFKWLAHLLSKGLTTHMAMTFDKLKHSYLTTVLKLFVSQENVIEKFLHPFIFSNQNFYWRQPFSCCFFFYPAFSKKLIHI